MFTVPCDKKIFGTEKVIYLVPLFENNFYLPTKVFNLECWPKPGEINIELLGIIGLLAGRDFFKEHQKPEGLNQLIEMQDGFLSEDWLYTNGLNYLVVIAPGKIVEKLYRVLMNKRKASEKIRRIYENESAYVKYISKKYKTWYSVKVKEEELQSKEIYWSYRINAAILN